MAVGCWMFLAGVAQAGEPVSEAELVRRLLAGPVATAELDAVDARARADRTARPVLESTAVEARVEQARGDWGATTRAVGASATLDLGLSALTRTRAGSLRGEAGRARRQATALDAVCSLRSEVVALWAANRSAGISEASQDRLDRLLQTLTALAEAGEASGYERDRTALAVVAHQTERADRRGVAAGRAARVSSLVGGEPVDDVALAFPATLPALDAALALVADHPVVQVLELELQAHRADRDAARRDQLPDLTVAAGPRWDAAPTGGPGTRGFEVAGAVQIPFTDGSRAEARLQTAEHADAEARLVRARAALQARVRGAHGRALALTDEAPATAPDAVWTAALDRYTAGESSLDELLQVSEAVEAAHLAAVKRERLARQARLELSCATGRLPEPTLQSALVEASR